VGQQPWRWQRVDTGPAPALALAQSRGLRFRDLGCLRVWLAGTVRAYLDLRVDGHPAASDQQSVDLAAHTLRETPDARSPLRWAPSFPRAPGATSSRVSNASWSSSNSTCDATSWPASSSSNASSSSRRPASGGRRREVERHGWAVEGTVRASDGRLEGSTEPAPNCAPSAMRLVGIVALGRAQINPPKSAGASGMWRDGGRLRSAA
jgi:hypothetical protein